MKIIETIKRLFGIQEIESIIYDLLDSGAVRFDVIDNSETCTYRPYDTFLRITSTRELLSDEIRDRILNNWPESLKILSQEESIRDRFNFLKITGLCVCQSDWGFDCASLTFKEDHHEYNSYRW